MSHAAFRSAAFAFVAHAALTGCGGSGPPPVASPPPPPPTTASAAADSSAAQSPPPAQTALTTEEGHKLVVLAASCWLGGIWGDALGEQDPQAKATGNETRCHELERRVWSSDDKTHFEQLRALEQNAVSDVVAAVDVAGKADSVDGPRHDALVKLTGALAEAARETMLARRAGDRVKRDLAREPDKLNGDEVSAVGPLRAHAKLETLLKLDAGDLSKEANALGLLLATDRVDVARGLPKHLKLYAVADVFNLVFGVTVPDVPSDATQKLVPGTFLKFLVATASSAGHPVADSVKTARERDALAWAGVQQGFGEKLAADADGIAPSTDLSKVVTVALHRMETEFAAQQAAAATLKDPPKHQKSP